MWGPVLEIGLGYAGFSAALIFAASRARQFLKTTAHIEDLKTANRQTQDQLDLLNTLLRTSPDAIVFVNGQGTIMRCNDSLATMFGHEPDALIGENVAVLMSSENAVLLREDIQRNLETGDSMLVGTSFESEGVASTGRAFPIELAITRFGEDDEPGFAGFIRDISWRRAAENKEKSATEQLSRVVDGALDAIVVIDGAGEVVSFNPAAEEIFGYSEADILGIEMSDLIIPEQYRDAHKNALKRYFDEGPGPVINSRIELPAIRSNGEQFDLELAIIDIKTDDRTLFVGCARDITDRKQFESQLLEAKNTAENANKAKASFLAMMSHEIRTPLNGVLGMLTLLRDGGLTADQKRLVKTAQNSGRSLLAIINDILDFSKLEAGTIDIEKAAFNLYAMVDSVVSIASSSSLKTKLKLGLIFTKVCQMWSSAIREEFAKFC